MKKITKVGSYAEAESRGIKPVDSIISIGSPVYFVEKKTPPYEVVGYGQGFTYKEGEVNFPNKFKRFLLVSENAEESKEIVAINIKLAKKMAKDIFGKANYAVYERKMKKVM
jgi:hypothetical protein